MINFSTYEKIKIQKYFAKNLPDLKIKKISFDDAGQYMSLFTDVDHYKYGYYYCGKLIGKNINFENNKKASRVYSDQGII